MKKLVVLITMLVLMFAGCAKKEKSSLIEIKGSDTIVNLAQRLAENFMKKNPDISLAVTGGGSGIGIAAMIEGNAALANSSRAMKDKEIKLAKEKGIIPIPIVIALDGLAVIVNSDLKIDSMTIENISGLYRGDIKNWKEIGGPDLEVSLYGRTSASGTYVYFRDNVLKWDYSQNMKEMNGNSQVVEAVKKDKAGIGYVGIGYIVDGTGNVIPGIKPLKITKNKGSAPVSPLDVENVKSGAYPLARPLFQYVSGKPAGKILELIKFELSDEGQKIVIKEGFYPVSKKYIEENKKQISNLK